RRVPTAGGTWAVARLQPVAVGHHAARRSRGSAVASHGGLRLPATMRTRQYADWHPCRGSTPALRRPFVGFGLRLTLTAKTRMATPPLRAGLAQASPSTIESAAR